MYIHTYRHTVSKDTDEENGDIEKQNDDRSIRKKNMRNANSSTALLLSRLTTHKGH